VNIVIPRTIEQAKRTLAEVGGLLTAKEWERAAIVYAFTKPGTGGRRVTAASTPQLTFRAFADLKISGLRTEKAVGAYHSAWADAIKDGAVESKPGKTVTLPTHEFPAYRENHDPTASERNVRMAIKQDPTVLVRAMRSGADEDIEAVAEAMAEAQTDPLVHEKVAEKVIAKTTHIPRHQKAPGTDWSKVARAVVMNHSRADTELDNLIDSLKSNPIYDSQIEEVIKHLRRDLTETPQRIADLTALIDGEDVAPRTIRNVTPVKELA
jgi:hypothetical protein